MSKGWGGYKHRTIVNHEGTYLSDLETQRRVVVHRGDKTTWLEYWSIQPEKGDPSAYWDSFQVIEASCLSMLLSAVTVKPAFKRGRNNSRRQHGGPGTQYKTMWDDLGRRRAEFTDWKHCRVQVLSGLNSVLLRYPYGGRKRPDRGNYAAEWESMSRGLLLDTTLTCSESIRSVSSK